MAPAPMSLGRRVDAPIFQDLFREDALDNDIFKELNTVAAFGVSQADDPANCLLHEGFAGIIFEGRAVPSSWMPSKTGPGDAGKLPQLREESTSS